MSYYIFLTDEGYTFQPNSESDMSDIENLQVIGISKGEDSSDAFYELVDKKKYLLETTFDEVFCYRLHDDYKNTYSEFSIQSYYEQELCKVEDNKLIINKIKEDMDLGLDESYKVFGALMDITRKNISIVKDIILKEAHCNYYLDVESYYELACRLVDDEGVWEDIQYDKKLYEFLMNEQDEVRLKERLRRDGWFINGGFSICLDDEIVEKLNM